MTLVEGTQRRHPTYTSYIPELLGVIAMPKAVVELSEHANRVVNVVKARDGLRGKSEALEAIVAAYEQNLLDLALRPEFVAELKRVRSGKFRRVRSTDELLAGTP